MNSIDEDKKNHEEYFDSNWKYLKYHRLFHSALQNGTEVWKRAAGFTLDRERVRKQYIFEYNWFYEQLDDSLH